MIENKTAVTDFEDRGMGPGAMDFEGGGMSSLKNLGMALSLIAQGTEFC